MPVVCTVFTKHREGNCIDDAEHDTNDSRSRTRRTAEQFIVGGRAWQDNSCGGPCARTELIEMVFGNEG